MAKISIFKTDCTVIDAHNIVLLHIHLLEVYMNSLKCFFLNTLLLDQLRHSSVVGPRFRALANKHSGEQCTPHC